MSQSLAAGSRWIRVCIPVGVILFVLALFLSAILLPQFRMLHIFQALIYVAILLLTQRNSAWGFGAGVIVPAAWNCLNLFITRLIQAGAAQLWSFLRTGHVTQPDTLMVLLGGGAHFLLIAACIGGILQLRPGPRQCAEFLGGGLAATAYFALIIAVMAPR